MYWDALVWYEHDRGSYRATPDTAAIFSTFPARHLSLAGGVADQVLLCCDGNCLLYSAVQVTSTALLLLCVCAITDRRNLRVSPPLVPVTYLVHSRNKIQPYTALLLLCV